MTRYTPETQKDTRTEKQKKTDERLKSIEERVGKNEDGTTKVGAIIRESDRLRPNSNTFIPWDPDSNWD